MVFFVMTLALWQGRWGCPALRAHSQIFQRGIRSAAESVLEADLGERSAPGAAQFTTSCSLRASGKVPTVTTVTQYSLLPWRRMLELGVPAGVAAVLNFCSHPQAVEQMPLLRSSCPQS